MVFILLIIFIDMLIAQGTHFFPTWAQKKIIASQNYVSEDINITNIRSMEKERNVCILSPDASYLNKLNVFNHTRKRKSDLDPLSDSFIPRGYCNYTNLSILNPNANIFEHNSFQTLPKGNTNNFLFIPALSEESEIFHTSMVDFINNVEKMDTLRESRVNNIFSQPDCNHNWQETLLDKNICNISTSYTSPLNMDSSIDVIEDELNTIQYNLHVHPTIPHESESKYFYYLFRL